MIFRGIETSYYEGEWSNNQQNGYGVRNYESVSSINFKTIKTKHVHLGRGIFTKASGRTVVVMVMGQCTG